MSSVKPSIPKGTRDFGPEQMGRRNFIFDTIKTTFKKFGFQQIETPSMENLTVLTGKYGDEGDQLIFKILNSGDYLKDIQSNDLDKGVKYTTPILAEKALRYDLTVPFARFVVMNQHAITMPFKRFQIQPVWRADRPQKGRYREFYQCDADVVGTDSLICEAEIVLMINEVLSTLGIPAFSIKINNRKILSGIARLLNAADKETDLFVAIDKLDKIGIDKVCEELETKGFSADKLATLKTILSLTGSFTEKLATIASLMKDDELTLQGIEEIQQVVRYVEAYGLKESNLEFDITLARGLSYYTGAIFEVKAHNVQIGSISGGGRYDNLTGVFGLEGVPGVGFSFGVDRVYDVMQELGLFKNEQIVHSQVMLCNFDEKSEIHALGILSEIRAAGIHSEIYPSSVKIKKQFSYANSKGIPYLLMIGEDEIAQKRYTLKDMRSGEQFTLSVEEVIAHIQNTNY